MYISRITSCAQKLVSMSDPVSDGDLLFCLLNGLPDTYDAFKAMMRLKDKVDFPTAVQHLKDEYEISRLKDSITQDNTALFAGQRPTRKRTVTNPGLVNQTLRRMTHYGVLYTKVMVILLKIVV